MTQLVAGDFCFFPLLIEESNYGTRKISCPFSSTMILLDFGNGSFSSKTLIDKITICYFQKVKTFNTFLSPND